MCECVCVCARRGRGLGSRLHLTKQFHVPMKKSQVLLQPVKVNGLLLSLDVPKVNTFVSKASGMIQGNFPLRFAPFPTNIHTVNDFDSH